MRNELERLRYDMYDVVYDTPRAAYNGSENETNLEAVMKPVSLFRGNRDCSRAGTYCINIGQFFVGLIVTNLCALHNIRRYSKLHYIDLYHVYSSFKVLIF